MDGRYRTIKPRPRRAPHRLRGAAKQANARARELELRIWTLLSAGKSPSAIAREVGVARQLVHRIIRRVEARYHQMIGATVEQWRARQLRMLENAFDEAMEAWERSKQPARRVRKKAGRAADADGAGHDPALVLTETQVETRAGEVRFLAEARAALADIRKLYGLDAPKGGGAPELGPGAFVVQWGGDSETASQD